jgi:hypothetical protein
MNNPTPRQRELITRIKRRSRRWWPKVGKGRKNEYAVKKDKES